jgi:hypothetical protein
LSNPISAGEITRFEFENLRKRIADCPHRERFSSLFEVMIENVEYLHTCGALGLNANASWLVRFLISKVKANLHDMECALLNSRSVKH